MTSGDKPGGGRAPTDLGGLVRREPLVEYILRHEFPDRPYMIGVDGLAGSGKTTFSAGLAEAVESRGVSVGRLALDDGFWIDNASHEAHDEPQMLSDYDWKRLKADVLDPLRNGQRISPYGACAVLIVEGSFTLRNETHECFDLKVFVCIPRREGLQRAIERDGVQSQEYYERYWQHQEDYYLQLHDPVAKAHLVIDGSRPPHVAGWPVAVPTPMSQALERMG